DRPEPPGRLPPRRTGLEDQRRPCRSRVRRPRPGLPGLLAGRLVRDVRGADPRLAAPRQRPSRLRLAPRVRAPGRRGRHAMTAAADLEPGPRIAAAGIGVLTVTTVYADPDPDALVEVDAEPDRGCDIWDMRALAAAAGAESAQWLSNTPRWRYR